MSENLNAVRLSGQVRIVGTGLLGASIGLRLRSLGVEVVLDDVSPSSVRLAADLGAGRAAGAGDSPVLVVVAVPQDVTADGLVMRAAERAGLRGTVRAESR